MLSVENLTQSAKRQCKTSKDALSVATDKKGYHVTYSYFSSKTYVVVLIRSASLSYF